MSLKSEKESLSKDKEEEYQKIINLCTLKLEKDPLSKKALLLRANIYMKLQQYFLAEEDLKKIQNDILLSSTVYFLLGCIYKNKKDYEKSIEYLSKSIELDSNNLNSLFLRGAVYNIMGYYNEAINDYSIALKLDSLLDSRKNIYKNITQIFENEKKEEKDEERKKNNLNDENIYKELNCNTNNPNKFDLDSEINNYLKSEVSNNFKRERNKSINLILSNLPNLDEINKNHNRDMTKYSDNLYVNDLKENNDYERMLNDSSYLNKSDLLLLDSLNKDIFEEKYKKHCNNEIKMSNTINNNSFNIKNSKVISPIKRKSNISNNSCSHFSSQNRRTKRNSLASDTNSEDFNFRLITSCEFDSDNSNKNNNHTNSINSYSNKIQIKKLKDDLTIKKNIQDDKENNIIIEEGQTNKNWECYYNLGVSLRKKGD